MKHLEKLKEALCEELDKFAKSGDITVNSLEKIHKLTDTIKNIDKIMALEAEEGGYSEGHMVDSVMHGNSYARGRRYAKRDSMGRYSRDDGYSEEDSSYARDGRGGSRGNRGGYSRDDAKDDMMNRLGEMMEDADPKEREALKECMRAIERA
jgi:hypothetical protein